MFSGKIKVYVKSATNLMEPDRVKDRQTKQPQLNCYVVMELDGEEMERTTIKTKTVNPVWKEFLYTPDEGVYGAELLKFTVKHKSEDSIDAVVGECSVYLPALLEGRTNKKNRIPLKESLIPVGELNLHISTDPAPEDQQLIRRRKAFHKKVHYHRGHKFQAKTFTSLAFCSYCSKLLWGLKNQGYQCLNCDMTAHKDHYQRIWTSCTGIRLPSIQVPPDYVINFDIPHDFRPQRFIFPMCCDHCGILLLGGMQGFQCYSCNKVAHRLHVDKFPNDCGVDREKMSRALEGTFPGVESMLGLAVRSGLDHSVDEDEPGDETHAQEGAAKAPDPQDSSSDDEDEWIVDPVGLGRTVLKDFIRKSNIYHSLDTKPSLNDFEMIMVLGQGAYGKVFKVEHKKTRQVFALKAISKQLIVEGDDVDIILREKNILALADKNNFLTQLHSAFQNKQYLFLVLEFVSGGDLFYHMGREKRFSEEKARFYSAELILALTFLHKNGIIHRDIKLDNVLIDNKGHVKLADFGMCKTGIYPGQQTYTICGTPDYISPEVLGGKGYGESCDWWGFGVLLYEMLAGRSPFGNRDDDEEEIFRNMD